MFFLTPRHVKHGKQFAKDARKLVAYKRDVWSDATVADVESHIKTLEGAVRERDAKKIEDAAAKLDALVGKHVTAPSDGWLRENVEVFLVAIVVALGVRTYFLQPFTIPTGSMQPTLNGIIFHETKESTPNFLLRFAQGAIFGRHYVDFVAEERERLIGKREIKSPLPFISKVPGFGGIFSRTELMTESETGKLRTYVIKETPETVDSQYYRFAAGKIFEKGEPIIRGYFDAGDHVFVDKVSYHFRKPKRAETFVFTTKGIPPINPPDKPSTFYIKRLAGLPGDTLQVRAPHLFINGEMAKEPAFLRVMSGTPAKPNNGYMGYGNRFDQTRWDQPAAPSPLIHLGSPDDVFTVPKVPKREYFALGDNSYNSYDSRGWGTVPEKNIMGRALVVYWPFWPHFGLSK
jgi:signal peptidase I